MWILLVFSALSLLPALAKTFGPQQNLGEAFAGYAIAVCLFELWRFAQRNTGQRSDLATWLIANRAAIEKGTAKYKGISVDPRTKLTQFSFAISFLLISVQSHSRFYLVGREPIFLPALAFTAASLILGWWGLPYGPIFTVIAVASNLKGGKRICVGDLLCELSSHPKDGVQLTERAAENARRIMSDRGFPDSAAVQIGVTGKRDAPQYCVTYDDLPPTDSSVWKSESRGVPVIVPKRDRRQLAGLVVDFVDGNYTFSAAAGVQIEDDIL